MQVRVWHERRRAGLPRDTMCVITSRDDVRDRLKRRRTWLPRETTSVVAARDGVCDCLKRRRTWSSWSQCSPWPRVRAGVVTGSDLSQTWRASWRLVIVIVVVTPQNSPSLVPSEVPSEMLFFVPLSNTLYMCRFSNCYWIVPYVSQSILSGSYILCNTTHWGQDRSLYLTLQGTCLKSRPGG